jgi:DNA-3-methyladenine glycosylase II
VCIGLLLTTIKVDGFSAAINQIVTMARPHIHSEADLDLALSALGEADPRFTALLAKTGRPPLRRREDGFAALAAIIVAQQLSTASADAIWGRLAAAFDPFEPEAILRARPARLARVGLSAPKIRALKAIARAVKRGELALAGLAELAAEEAHAALTAIHGIGPWTADIYLLSCLGHGDAWPAGDLALQEAARVAFALPARPTEKEMLALAETWRPWRAVAARILWSYYRAAAVAAKAATKAATKTSTKTTSTKVSTKPAARPPKRGNRPAQKRRRFNRSKS